MIPRVGRQIFGGKNDSADTGYQGKRVFVVKEINMAIVQLEVFYCMKATLLRSDLVE